MCRGLGLLSLNREVLRSVSTLDASQAAPPQRHLGDSWGREVDPSWAEDLTMGGSGIIGAFMMTRGHCGFFPEGDSAQTQSQQVGVLPAQGARGPSDPFHLIQRDSKPIGLVGTAPRVFITPCPPGERLMQAAGSASSPGQTWPALDLALSRGTGWCLLSVAPRHTVYISKINGTRS